MAAMTPRPRRFLAAAIPIGALLLAWSQNAGAIDAWDGRVRIGGEFSGTLSPVDRGYFNYSSYGQDALRLFRASVTTEVQPVSGLALLAEVRSDNLRAPKIYALYLRVRPWRKRVFDVQAGQVPPVFGAFARRRYASAEALPGVPLAFQYLTSLRADALPRSADELFSQRGRGWSPSYALATYAEASGLPFMDAGRWDVGVEARAGSGPLEIAASVTRGSLSRPQASDNSGQKQLAARLAWHPSPAWNVGVSAARGEYLSGEAVASLASSRPAYQAALGADLEYASGHWILCGEVIWSQWEIPAIAAPLIAAPVSGRGGFVEVRYKIAPGLTLAARGEHLSFSRVATNSGIESWEAPVSRLEAGLKYALRPNVDLKGAFQGNWRNAGRVHRENLVIAQVLLWF
jgi:hypothetical protein